MIRKQISVTKQQEQYLKEKSKSTGMTEAEIVRRALDKYIQEEK